LLRKIGEIAVALKSPRTKQSKAEVEQEFAGIAESIAQVKMLYKE
jgi:hypothetical protein